MCARVHSCEFVRVLYQSLLCLLELHFSPDLMAIPSKHSIGKQSHTGRPVGLERIESLTELAFGPTPSVSIITMIRTIIQTLFQQHSALSMSQLVRCDVAVVHPLCSSHVDGPTLNGRFIVSTGTAWKS